uniref:Uncharacterized mitochondrial protein AtMg00810-like n=1 Tax=Tanacetum cinerariifolium TaxID=118510 RepID=A0A6L2JDZ8_TANCI|nr:uncharacterized mitochondrial protein AtMg00810-like [Tanacetum cinerariifolium]
MSIPPRDEPSTNQPEVKLLDRNAVESWVLLEDLALYDNESWNDPMDFAKPFKAISLPQDVLSTSDLLAHSPTYNAILDKYVESLELGKNGSTFIQGEMPKKMKDLKLFALPCRLGNSEPFDTLDDLGSCVNIIPLYLFKKLTIKLLEETDHIFRLADGTKSYPVGIVKNVEVHIGRLKLLEDLYVKNMKKDPETPLLVGRGLLATANAMIDCRKTKIMVGKGITKKESYRTKLSTDGIGAQTSFYARKDLDHHLPEEWELARDAELNPFKDILVFRKMVEFLGAIPINLKNILKQNQGDVTDALGYKKKAIVITSDPLALVAEKTNVSKRKEKVVVSSDSKGSSVDDFSELKKITALLAKAFNRRKFYSKPTNNNLRTSSTSQSANKKQEFFKSNDKKEDKKADEKKRDMSKVKCYNCKKEGHFDKDYNDEQVLFAEEQAWMESSSDFDQEINANMVFMAQIEKFFQNQTKVLHLMKKPLLRENDCQVVEIECDKEENSKVITHGMFKLSVSQSVSPILMTKTSCESNNVENVVIGSMTIKKVYYVKGLGHNLFSVGQFCDKGLEVAFRKSTCFVRNEDGVDLLTGDRSLNLYTIALNEVASNSSTCLLAKASSSQSWLWHQRLSHLNFATINNLVKNNLVQGLPKMKFEKDHLCSACEQGKIHRKHHKSKTAFASNKPLYLFHMDLCGLMHVVSINRKRFVLVVVDDYSRYTWVFFFHSKDEASKVIISFIKKTQVNLQLQVQHVRTDNGTEFKNKTLAKFFDEAKGDIGVFVRYSKESAAFRIYNKQTRKIHESVNIMKSSTTNVETSINEEVFHENSESFQGEFSSSLLNDYVQQSSEEEEVYVGQPPGFVSKHYPDHVYAFDKALYGLKQAPRAWYDVLLQFLIDSDFQKGSIDTTLFIKKKGKHIMLIQIYVDDIIFGSTNPKYCTKFLDLMVKRFEMSMMGEMKFFLGLQVNQFSNGIFINQSKYILDILKIFGMENCDTVPTPMVEQAKLKLDLVGKPVDHTDYRSMIRSLIYVTSSRPDIMFATCMYAKYQANPNEHYVSAVKRIFRYLKWTINLGLWYPKDSGFDLTAYSNADHAGCHLGRKSTSGSVQFLGDKLVCWSSKKQNCVSIPTAESEYVAVSNCCVQVLWMRTQLTDYGFFYDKLPIYCDSKSAIAISCNPVQHTRTKHIDVRTGIDLPRSLSSHLGKLCLETKSEFCKEPIVKSSSPTLTPFEESDFFGKIEDFLKEESIPKGIDDSFYDPEGDILYLEKLLNDDPSQLPLLDHKQAEETKVKSSIEEPPELELKELPSHLEYAFLEETDKLPIPKTKRKQLSHALMELLLTVACPSACVMLLYNSKSSNPTLVSNPSSSEETKCEFCKDPIVKSSSATLTPFGESDFLLEEFEDFLKDESIPTGIEDSYYDPEGDILYLEKLLNDDPSQLLSMDLKQAEETKAKSSIEEPPKLELKELPSHLEYTFLEETDKLPVIIAKDLKNNEKEALLKVLKSHKRAIAWKITDIKGHKISKSGIEVDRAKVDVIAKLPHPTTVKGVRSFLGHAEAIDILKACHEGPTGGHHGANLIAKKGIDFMGPFPYLRGNMYILVAIDYLSKWVEAKTLPTNDARVVVKFLKSLFARFGTPRAIISDRGTHFCNDQFAKVMIKYVVTHRLATAYHPQTSGQVKVSNRGLKRILERTVGENRASWSDKLDDALWAFRIAFKTPIGCTIYKLVYEKSCHLPIELEHKIFSGKPKTRWSGPFTIAQVFPYGTVEFSQLDGPNFKVNDHRVKHYFRGDIPSKIIVLISKDFDMKIFPLLTLLVLVLVITCLGKGRGPVNGTYRCAPDNANKKYCCYVNDTILQHCNFATSEVCRARCECAVTECPLMRYVLEYPN